VVGGLEGAVAEVEELLLDGVELADLQPSGRQDRPPALLLDAPRIR
jgi:hypothetical protein